jgi:hypothetical protein
LPKAMLVGLSRTPANDTPVPVRESDPFTVPKIFSVPLRLPVVAGVKTRMTVQDALAAIVPAFTHVPVPVFEKLVPEMEKYGVESTSVAVPMFETVIVSGLPGLPIAWLPKDAGEGEKESAGKMPVPVRAFDPLAVPKIFSVAVRLPVAVGEKVRITVQEPETAIVPAFAQLPPVLAKSAAFAPVSVKNGVERTSLAVPMLDTVTVIGELVVLCN